MSSDDRLERGNPPRKQDQYRTTCPHCGEGNELYVREITMATTGRKMQINVQLSPDGFAFDPNDDEILDASTTDEKVVCRECRTEIPLTELTN